MMEQQQAQTICDMALEVFKAADQHVRRSPSDDDLKYRVHKQQHIDCRVLEGDLVEENALRQKYIRPAMAILARSVPCGAMFLDSDAKIEIPLERNETVEATAKSEFLTLTLMSDVEFDRIIRFDIMILEA